MDYYPEMSIYSARQGTFFAGVNGHTYMRVNDFRGESKGNQCFRKWKTEEKKAKKREIGIFREKQDTPDGVLIEKAQEARNTVIRGKRKSKNVRKKF